MVSNVLFSQTPHRTMPKFGEAHTHPSPAPTGHKTTEHPEPSFMIEVDLKGKETAAQTKKSLIQPFINDAHAALAKVPGMAISAISAALIGLGISKFMAKHTPSAKSLEKELSELKMKKRAETIGSKKGELAILPTLIAITAGGKVVEEATKAVFSLPTETYKAWIGTKYKKP